MAARIITPTNIKSNEPFEVRILIQHAMETGYRLDLMGTLIAKNVIKNLTVTYLDAVVFKASLGTGIAANPSLQFWMRAPQNGLLMLSWEDDLGVMGQAEKLLEVK